MSEAKYEMSIDLNVLNHLGLNLYSNVPAVLSEVVANSWDADATEVDIKIESDKITITDNGHGMTYDDINGKYLKVGYERRRIGGGRTANNRRVMGRKGIGKLSLFSIANTVEVQSFKGKEKHGFVMSVQKIKERISKEKGSTYHPDSLSDDEITLDTEGTRILLTGLKKGVSQVPAALRKRLARRFSIIGEEHKFKVCIDGNPVEITDRDYFHKIQYLWHYGEESEKYVEWCSRSGKLEHDEKRDDNVPVENGEASYQVTGWIGTAVRSGDLKDGEDNLNKLVIMVRGKLAQEDILEDFTEGGLYTKYLIGEIHADFLDHDDLEDIATSNRQEIIKDNPRYIALQSWVKEELRYIKNQWTKLRNKGAEEDARQTPAIDKWMNTLRADTREKAREMFGKIAELPMETDEQRKELYQYSALAFESLDHKGRLSELATLSPENIQQLVRIFADQAEIEASHYYKIVNHRLSIIEALDEMVEENTIEKTIQNHLADNLWLLDPSWERAADAVYVEQRVAAAFKEIDDKLKLRKDELSKEERTGRIDIRYKKMYGHHVIIELKRPEVKANDYDLMKQVEKYETALQKELDWRGEGDDSIEIVCIVGEELRQWMNPTRRLKSKDSLADKNIRVVLYRELIRDARLVYKEFLEKKEEAGRISQLIKNIEIEIP